MNLYKKCTFVSDNSDNCFKQLSKFRDEELQYDISREDAEISALSSGKTDKYEYLTGEEIIPPGQKRVIESAKFTYSPVGEAFEKQIKTIEDQGHLQSMGNNLLNLMMKKSL